MSSSYTHLSTHLLHHITANHRRCNLFFELLSITVACQPTTSPHSHPTDTLPASFLRLHVISCNLILHRYLFAPPSPPSPSSPPSLTSLSPPPSSPASHAIPSPLPSSPRHLPAYFVHPPKPLPHSRNRPSGPIRVRPYLSLHWWTCHITKSI